MKREKTVITLAYLQKEAFKHFMCSVFLLVFFYTAACIFFCILTALINDRYVGYVFLALTAIGAVFFVYEIKTLLNAKKKTFDIKRDILVRKYRSGETVQNLELNQANDFSSTTTHTYHHLVFSSGHEIKCEKSTYENCEAGDSFFIASISISPKGNRAKQVYQCKFYELERGIPYTDQAPVTKDGDTAHATDTRNDCERYSKDEDGYDRGEDSGRYSTDEVEH